MTEQESPRAVASLVFGVLSYVLCPVVGAILAIVLGAGERSGLARAGVALGWIHLALVVLSGLATLVVLLVAAAVNA